LFNVVLFSAFLFEVSYVIITNIEIIPGKTVVKHLGMVQGNTVRAKHVGRDIMAGFKNIFGGELKGYTELLQEAREESVARMTQQAEAIGANAVINVRFSTSSITAGAAELFAYGTAVILE
jgi:uncharacterized protein YbjQ (UPF0145 family)